ncbi:hypothetical protein SG34_033630 [Thalassomonas viridans]|uniref:Uncharacterized protein n=1 Tax=Thalassomonas viridans TaxID=137584 RepID=A0AAF0CDI1_9GAMM|nr:hypothetical protein [Thalassomonas viridans]WDE08836.1 hypothetical protein SG34_033630 [Thalassomonas viridans]
MSKKLLLSSLLLISGLANGACIKSNSVDTPTLHINNNNSRFGLIWISNTSDKVVDVSIKVYDQNGSDVSPSVVSGGVLSHSLPAKGSDGFVLYGNGADRTVFSEITWKSSQCVTTPLNASMETQWGSSVNIQNINAGQQF